MSPTPITARSPRPLFNHEGVHWFDHGRAVYHVMTNGTRHADARVDVYSRMNDRMAGPVVSLHTIASPFCSAFDMPALEARRLAGMLIAAADTADRVAEALAGDRKKTKNNQA